MDFFKSVFSDDPDPSDPQTDPTSPSQSPKTQEPNQDQEPDQEQDQESPLLDPTSNPESSSSSTSAWNFGGLMKTLATKSETVIQTYRRDLEEFGSGLKKETEAIREAASRAVKELPSSIEVGASVAQNSLESVGNVIDEFGNSVWRGTSEIISTSKDSISILADVESDSSDTQYYRHSSSRPYSRFELQVHAIQSDLATYSEQPDDMGDFSKWKSGFVLEEKRDEIDELVAENGVMEDAYVKLVPSVVDHETFWSRYFYRVYKFKQAEDARANLVKRAISGEEEDLSWGDDDDDEDDDNGYESKSVSVGVNTQKEDTPEIDKQSETLNSSIVDGETTDKNPTPTPAPAPASTTATAPAPAQAPTNVEEAVSENVSRENIESEKKGKEVESSEVNSEPSKSEVKMVPTEKDGQSESSKPVVESKPSHAEEDDIEWDEIEDMESDTVKRVSVGGSPNKVDLRKRLSTAEEEEDLSWGSEDDDEPVKH